MKLLQTVFLAVLRILAENIKHILLFKVAFLLAT